MDTITQEYEYDDEFRFLIQPYVQSDINEKNEFIRQNGCMVPIHVWNNTIVEGYERYEICKELNIPCSVIFDRFSCREEAYEYICKMQLKRKDLTAEMKKYLIGRVYQAVYSIQSKKYYDCLRSDYSISGIKPVRKTEVASQVANDLQISISTVVKYDQYASCIENVRKKIPQLAVTILRGEIKISHENFLELIRLPKDNMQVLCKDLKDSGISHISSKDIRRSIKWKPDVRKPAQKKEAVSIPEIRKMPEYDPNAEITAITLTIPAWIDSLERFGSRGNYSSATNDAINAFQEQLLALCAKAEQLFTEVEQKEVNPNE